MDLDRAMLLVLPRLMRVGTEESVEKKAQVDDNLTAFTKLETLRRGGARRRRRHWRDDSLRTLAAPT